MYGINYQRSVYMLVVLIHKYLVKAGTHKIRESYTGP